MWVGCLFCTNWKYAWTGCWKIPSSTVIGVGFAPAGFVAGAPVAGTIDPVAGTIAPPVPDTSPVGLSMALETTADNLHFQVSAGAKPISPSRLINVKPTVKQQLSSCHWAAMLHVTYLYYGVFSGHVQIHMGHKKNKTQHFAAMSCMAPSADPQQWAERGSPAPPTDQTQHDDVFACPLLSTSSPELWPKRGEHHTFHSVP